MAKNKSKEYQFRIAIHGQGTTCAEAWEAAVEGFTCEPGGPTEDEGFLVEDCRVLNSDDGMLTVYDQRNSPWRLRLVRAGDRYGLNDSCTHGAPLGRERGGTFDPDHEPIVEFYDASMLEAHTTRPVFHTGRRNQFGVRGQFVASYYVSVLLEHDPRMGLDLKSGESRWVVDADVVRQVQRWLHAMAPVEAVLANHFRNHRLQDATIVATDVADGRVETRSALGPFIRANTTEAHEAQAWLHLLRTTGSFDIGGGAAPHIRVTMATPMARKKRAR